MIYSSRVLVLFAVTNPTDYKAQIEKWRAEREERLKSDTGWLTVAGLFWLQEGENSIGTAETDRIQLPSVCAGARPAASNFTAAKRR